MQQIQTITHFARVYCSRWFQWKSVKWVFDEESQFSWEADESKWGPHEVLNLTGQQYWQITDSSPCELWEEWLYYSIADSRSSAALSRVCHHQGGTENHHEHWLGYAFPVHMKTHGSSVVLWWSLMLAPMRLPQLCNAKKNWQLLIRTLYLGQHHMKGL